MNDREEQLRLARQILEKTEVGKVMWAFVPQSEVDPFWADAERYEANLEEGFSFSISRKTRNDDKLLTFELPQAGRVVFSIAENNLPIDSVERKLGISLILFKAEFTNREPIDSSKVERFRLLSDLFYAARKCAVREDQTIEKVQQLLERLG